MVKSEWKWSMPAEHHRAPPTSTPPLSHPHRKLLVYHPRSSSAPPAPPWFPSHAPSSFALHYIQMAALPPEEMLREVLARAFPPNPEERDPVTGADGPHAASYADLLAAIKASPLFFSLPLALATHCCILQLSRRVYLLLFFFSLELPLQLLPCRRAS